MSDTEWTDEEWQLDQAVMDAEEIRPSGQVARLRAIREEWPKLHATVAALTAENERQAKAISFAVGWLGAMLERRQYEDDHELREMQGMLADAQRVEVKEHG